ncbi:MAG: hypothetical protein AAF708_14215 [Deinococcota bacterium]
MTSIRISLNDDIERVLESLKRDYPTLDYPELFKLGLSELYRKRELETRQAWLDSLPTLEISEEEAHEIAEARQETGQVMSVDEILTASLSDE